MNDNITIVVSKKYSKKNSPSYPTQNEVQKFVSDLGGCIPGWNRNHAIKEITEDKILYECYAEDDSDHRNDLLYLKRHLEENHTISVVGDIDHSQIIEFLIET